MLISKSSYTAGDVVSFKLVNGDECVAKIVECTPMEFVVSKPCTVVPSAKGIGLMQSLFTAQMDKNVNLNATHVLMHAPVVKEIHDYYIQTTTGIATAPAGLVV
jgi:hypothetical protein